MEKKQTIKEAIKNYLQDRSPVAKNLPPISSESGEKLFFDEEGCLIKLYHKN